MDTVIDCPRDGYVTASRGKCPYCGWWPLKPIPETLYYVQGVRVTKEEQQAYFEANRKEQRGTTEN